jgi:pyridoxal phosphate enzyme (YggS family)
MSVRSVLQQLHLELPSTIKLVAVSKYHPISELKEAYDAGQRAFGENIPQELAVKVPQMPSDVEWHFLGHLQTNKLKLVLPYVHLVQSVDSMHLLESIDRWGRANDRTISVLLELHLGAEQTKHGFSEDEIISILMQCADYPNVRFCGLMGMATNTDDESIVKSDFYRISSFNAIIKEKFPELNEFKELSIGMSEDYPIAVSCGATIVRIGTKIFGPREY